MVAKTYNEELFDAMVRHQIGLLRYASGVRNKVWKILDATEADLKRQIKSLGAGASLESTKGIRQMKALLAALRKTRLAAWKDVHETWVKEMKGLAVAEPGFFERVLVNSAPGVELAFAIPSSTDMRNIAVHQPFMGKTLGEWGSNVQQSDLDRIENQIKIGLYQKESLPALSKRIVGSAKLNGRDGTTQITRRFAATITRTMVSGVAAETRRSFAEANADVLPFEVFIATLDSGTTPICRGNDGKKFKVGEGPRLPLHMGERSVYGPSFDGEALGERPLRPFTERSMLREFAEKKGIKAPLKRSGLPKGTKGEFDAFKRKRVRELTGTTPANVNYPKFLKGQSPLHQDDILGPTRGKLFRSGLPLDRFVELSGRELSLAELATRHTDVFLRAGLDPSLFK